MRLQALLAILVLLTLLPPASAQPSLASGEPVPAFLDYVPGEYDYLEFYSYNGGVAVFAAKQGDSYFLLVYNPENGTVESIGLPGSVRSVEGDSDYIVVHGKNYLVVYDAGSFDLLWRVDRYFDSVDYSNGMVVAAKIDPGTGVARVILFEASTGSPVLNETFSDLGMNIEVGLSPEGYIAVASDLYIIIIAPDGHIAGNVSVENLDLLVPAMVSWSSDGEYVSVMYNLGLIILGKHGEKRLVETAEDRGVPRWYVDQAWKPGDTLLAVAYRYGVKVYDASAAQAKLVMNVKVSEEATEGVYFGGLHRLQWDPEGTSLLLAVLGPYDSPLIRLFDVSRAEEVPLSPPPEDLPMQPSWAGWLSGSRIVVYTGYYGMDRWVKAGSAAVYASNGSLVSVAPLSNSYIAVAPLGDSYDVFVAYSPETGIVTYGWGSLTAPPGVEADEFFHGRSSLVDAYAVADKPRNQTILIDSDWAVVLVEESHAKATLYKLDGDTPSEAYEGLILELNLTFKNPSSSGEALLEVEVSGDETVDYVYYATAPGDATVEYASGRDGTVRIIVSLPSTAPGSHYTIVALLGHRPPIWLPPKGNVSIHVELKPLGGGETQTTVTSPPEHATTTTTTTTTIKTIIKTVTETPETAIHTLETATGSPAMPAGGAGFAGEKGGGKQNTTLIAIGAIIVVIVIAAVFLARR